MRLGRSSYSGKIKRRFNWKTFEFQKGFYIYKKIDGRKSKEYHLANQQLCWRDYIKQAVILFVIIGLIALMFYMPWLVL